MSGEENPYIVKPVAKALGVLSYVAELGHETTLAAVMKQVRLPRTTCFRYLQTLAESGFLYYDRDSDRYGAGPRFRALARTDQNLHALRLAARPQMLILEQQFRETINLAVMSRAEVVYIEIVEARQTLRIQGRVGDRHPAHSTALGKAMLAQLPEAEVRARLDPELGTRTSRTLNRIDDLIGNLGRFRRNGYATEFEENEESAVCVASAILDPEGRPVAAVSLSAPKQRLQRAAVGAVGHQLGIAADLISRQLQDSRKQGD